MIYNIEVFSLHLVANILALSGGVLTDNLLQNLQVNVNTMAAKVWGQMFRITDKNNKSKKPI
jgi:hypothetical protein